MSAPRDSVPWWTPPPPMTFCWRRGSHYFETAEAAAHPDAAGCCSLDRPCSTCLAAELAGLRMAQGVAE